MKNVKKSLSLILFCSPAMAQAPLYFDIGNSILVFLLIVAVIIFLGSWIIKAKTEKERLIATCVFILFLSIPIIQMVIHDNK